MTPNLPSIIYNANENKNITIPKGTIIPTTFNTDWNTYLPTIPKTFCTYSNTSTPNKTTTSLFNFFVDNPFPKCVVYDKNNIYTFLKIDRNNKEIVIGSGNSQ
jgi:hypothetical protein